MNFPQSGANQGNGRNPRPKASSLKLYPIPLRWIDNSTELQQILVVHEQCQGVEHIYISKNSNRTDSTYAVVDFESPGAATSAKKQLEGVQIDAKNLKCEFFARRSKRRNKPNNSNPVHSNLPGNNLNFAPNMSEDRRPPRHPRHPMHPQTSQPRRDRSFSGFNPNAGNNNNLDNQMDFRRFGGSNRVMNDARIGDMGASRLTGLAGLAELSGNGGELPNFAYNMQKQRSQGSAQSVSNFSVDSNHSNHSGGSRSGTASRAGVRGGPRGKSKASLTNYIDVRGIAGSMTVGELKKSFVENGCENIVAILRMEANPMEDTYDVRVRFQTSDDATYAKNTMQGVGSYTIRYSDSKKSKKKNKGRRGSANNINDSRSGPQNKQNMQQNQMKLNQKESDPPDNFYFDAFVPQNAGKPANWEKPAYKSKNKDNRKSAIASMKREVEDFLCDNALCMSFHPGGEKIYWSGSAQCSHMLSSACLVPYVQSALNAGRLPTCPQHSCNVPLDYDTASQFLTESQVQIFLNLAHTHARLSNFSKSSHASAPHNSSDAVKNVATPNRRAKSSTSAANNKAGAHVAVEEKKEEEPVQVPIPCAGCGKDHMFSQIEDVWYDLQKEPIFCWPQCLHQYRRACVKKHLRTRIHGVHASHLRDGCPQSALPSIRTVFCCNQRHCSNHLDAQRLDDIMDDLFGPRKGSKALGAIGMDADRVKAQEEDDIGTMTCYGEYRTMLLLQSESYGISSNFDCAICFTTRPYESLSVANVEKCGGNNKCKVCRECARLWTQSAMMGNDSKGPSWPVCANTACKEKYEEINVRNLFSEEEFCRLYKRYQIPLEDRIVANYDDAERCPSCAHIAIVNDQRPHIFNCNKCHKIFCLKCGGNHGGALELQGLDELDTHNCDAYKAGKNVDVLDAQMGDYVKQQNVKKCPGCHQGVDKNKGCNHMTCRCGTHWCWVCKEVLDPENIQKHFDEANHDCFAEDDVLYDSD